MEVEDLQDERAPRRAAMRRARGTHRAGWRLAALAAAGCSGAATHERVGPGRAIGAMHASETGGAASGEQALARLFTAPRVRPEWLGEGFAAVVSAPQLQAMVTEMRTGALGAFRGVARVARGYELRFAHGTVPTEVTLDRRGRIAGMRVGGPQMNAIALDDALRRFSALPGRVGVLVVADGRPLAELHADAPLAVGSAFKLAVLAALRTQIEQRQHAWSEAVGLRADERSLPTGLLERWPEGTAVTLESLAALMISQSDNTATDTLMAVVGREAIEALAPRSRPVLSTLEHFVITAPANADLLERYRVGDEAARRGVLREAHERTLPSIGDFADGVPGVDAVEWFFSARELCALMDRVHDLPVMTINPGVADPRQWTRVAYKGGSETGVLNLTTSLETNARRYCVAATWNRDRALDEERFTSVYSALVAGLATER